MQRLLTLLSLFLLCTPAIHAQETCGFDAANAALIARDPVYATAVARMKQSWASHATAAAQQRIIVTGGDTTYEIPIVVHIVHTGGPVGSASNPTDAHINAMINFTNAAYAAQWAAYPSTATGGTRVPFQFVLAKRDPFCQPTTGILRVNGSGVTYYASLGISSGGAGADEVDVKALSRWPSSQYYNIWVVTDIQGGVAGYAYYPGAGPAVDGTVIAVGSTSVGSSTLVHELGHGMGLPHTFEGDGGGGVCPPNAACLTDGDGICDTEPHQRGLSCTDPTNTCTNAPPGVAPRSFLSYSFGCRDRFTPGQRDRMIFGLKNGRPSLMNSIGAVPAQPAPVTALCTPTHAAAGSTLNAGPHEVAFGAIYRASGGYTTEGAQAWLADFCNGRTDVFAGATYPISVKTGPQAERVAVYLDYNNDGQFQAPTELVFSSVGNVANQMHTGSITIPATGTLLCVPLRMRVVSDVLSAPAPAPCGTLAHGQAEDYAVTVKAPNPAILAISTPTNPSCYHDTVVFTATSASVPANTPVWWSLNGIAAGSGAMLSLSGLQPGDVVQAHTTAPNPACVLADTVRATAITISRLPSTSTPPVISYIGSVLVSPIAPAQWFYNGVAIPGATASSYQPMQPGNYYAVAKTLPCWSMPSNILNVSLLDIEKGPSRGGVRLYPNPATDVVTLEWEQPVGEVTLALYNAIGQVVLEKEAQHASSATLPVQGLPAGVYLLKIKDKSGSQNSLRLVVAR